MTWLRSVESTAFGIITRWTPDWAVTRSIVADTPAMAFDRFVSLSPVLGAVTRLITMRDAAFSGASKATRSRVS